MHAEGADPDRRGDAEADRDDLEQAWALLRSGPAPSLSFGEPCAIGAHVRACAVLARACELPKVPELVALLGRGKDVARRYVRLATLEPALIAAIESGDLSAPVAAEIARLDDTADRLVLAVLVREHRWVLAGDDGVRPIVRMVLDGRPLADVLRRRHGIDIAVSEPRVVVTMASWSDRAALQKRAWLHGTDPEAMLSRDIGGAVHEENARLRSCLREIRAVAHRCVS